MQATPDVLPPSARAWLLPADFNHFAASIAERHQPQALPYTLWVAAVKRSIPLAPACIDGPVHELPKRLLAAFSQACASSSTANSNLYVREKQEVLSGLGLQIVNLGLWGPGQPPVFSVLLGMEPLNSLNIEAVDDSRLRSRHGLEALECIFFITAIFFSVNSIDTPSSPAESPVSWIPYTVSPSKLPTKVERTAVPELAHRAMRFRDHRNLFNFSPSVSDPDAKVTGSTLNYWTSCAGLGGKGITSHLSSLVLKLVRCHELYEQQDHTAFALMRTTPQEEWAGNHQSSAISLISPVLLFLKTPVTSGTRPRPKGYFWLHALGCTPICINGVVDRAVVDFTAGLLDVLMELGFGQASPGDRWRNSSAKLTMLGKALAESTAPNWVDAPAQDPHDNGNALFQMDVDSDDDNVPDFSVPLDLASATEFPDSTSFAGPSTSTSAIAPATDGAGDLATAAEIQHLKRELKRTRRSLKVLKTMQQNQPAAADPSIAEATPGSISDPVKPSASPPKSMLGLPPAREMETPLSQRLPGLSTAAGAQGHSRSIEEDITLDRQLTEAAPTSLIPTDPLQPSLDVLERVPLLQALPLPILTFNPPNCSSPRAGEAEANSPEREASISTPAAPVGEGTLFDVDHASDLSTEIGEAPDGSDSSSADEGEPHDGSDASAADEAEASIPNTSPVHAIRKRQRAASSSPEPPRKSAVKRHRRRSPPANRLVAASKVASPPPSTHNDEDVDMEMDSVGDDQGDDRHESEEPVKFATAVKRLRTEFGSTKHGIVGKGKATNNQAPSSSKTSVPSAKKAKKADSKRSVRDDDTITSLGQCIPAAYQALGHPLDENELMELDWFVPTESAPSEKGNKAPVKDVPSAVSQALPIRRWHSFNAPRMTLDHQGGDVGEVRLSDAEFCFPYDALRGPGPDADSFLPDEQQPGIRPLLIALQMVEESKKDLMHAAYEPRIVTKEAILTASPSQLEMLLQHVVLVKNPEVQEKFKPMPAQTAAESSPNELTMIGRDGNVEETPMVNETEANLISLDPRAEYLEAVKVSYAAASALGGPQWINTSVLDFGLRYIHEGLRKIGLHHTANSVAILGSIFSYYILEHQMKGRALPSGIEKGWKAPLTAFASRPWWILPVTTQGHHVCGMIKNPLECLKSQSSGFTQVVTLDSLSLSAAEPEGNALWVHLLIDAWVALEGERESYGLSDTKPTMEGLLKRIEFHHPKVRLQQNTFDCGIHVIRNVHLALHSWQEAQGQLLQSQTAPMFKEDVISMVDFRAEVWDWMVRSTSGFSASTLDIQGFQTLSQGQRLDLAARYMADLGVDGDSTVSAQDQSQRNFEEPEMLKLRIKEVVASIMESGATGRVINALNMPSSASNPDMDIYRVVSSDNQADASLGPVNANAFVLGNRGHGLRKWTIVSSCGTYHTPHYDANGLCTLVTVREGYKLWVWGVRRSRSPIPTPSPELRNDSRSWHWALFDDCITYAVVLGPGDSLIMYSGLPHAVYSVALAGFKPTCAVVSGSHFISEYSMSRMLDAAISHSVWHDVWTNATHDDVVYHVDWMLHDLLLRSVNGIPSRILQNTNAFALFTYARFAPWLSSLPHQRHFDNPTWLRTFDPLADLRSRLEENPSTQAATRRMLDALDQLARKADEAISSLPPVDYQAFQAVWESSRCALESEIQRRVNYNITLLENDRVT